MASAICVYDCGGVLSTQQFTRNSLSKLLSAVEFGQVRICLIGISQFADCDVQVGRLRWIANEIDVQDLSRERKAIHMFAKIPRWGVVLAVLVGGCAVCDPPTPGPDHPAYPQAAAARHCFMLSTLEIDGAYHPSQPPEPKGGPMKSRGDGPIFESTTSREQE